MNPTMKGSHMLLQIAMLIVMLMTFGLIGLAWAARVILYTKILVPVK